MDFITCLQSFNGKTTIMTVVDRLTKYVHFIPLPSIFSTRTVAEAFVVDIIRLHDPPRSIVTDKCVEQYLRCYVAEVPSKWVAMLPWVEFWYNTSYQTSAGMTPFQALYGREPATVARYILGGSASELVDSYLLQWDEVLHILKNTLLKAQNRMKRLADKSRTDTFLEVGDWVYVKLKPFRQNTLRLQRDHKLGRYYFEPYQVLKRIGPVAYRLELPESTKIHFVFHISMLKRCVGTLDQQVTPLHLSVPNTEDLSKSNL